MYRLQQRVRETGSVDDRPRSEKPRVTTPREDRYIVTSSRRNRFTPATELVRRLRQATGTRISVHTARNRLRAARLPARRPYKGVPLTRGHRDARLDWTRHHSRWSRQRWNRAVFSDESKFNLHNADGRVRVGPPVVGYVPEMTSPLSATLNEYYRKNGRGYHYVS